MGRSLMGAGLRSPDGGDDPLDEVVHGLQAVFLTMEAMILAAGLGTRLRPLTHDIPKALVPVGDKPMLEHVARRLIDAGCDRLIINVHHHADQVLRFLDEHDNFGIDVAVSLEPDQALETGGGLKKAESLFMKKKPFFMHNSDVFTGINLTELYITHSDGNAVATLAVREAETNRFLLFDEDENLCGYGDREGNEHITGVPKGGTARLDFCGVQVISPDIFALMTETGVFSIINTYLRLSKEGHRIRPHRIDGAVWIDIGKPESLDEARALLESGWLPSSDLRPKR